MGKRAIVGHGVGVFRDDRGKLDKWVWTCRTFRNAFSTFVHVESAVTSHPRCRLGMSQLSFQDAKISSA